MISNDRKNQLKAKAAAISIYIDHVYGEKVYLLDELMTRIRDLMSGNFKDLFRDCTKDERDFVTNIILENKDVRFDPPQGLINDESRTWFTDDKERENFFFERYRRYIASKNGFNEKTLDSFSQDVLDPILNQLGNPKSTEPFGRYGLIVGDVQSGKTMNYIGMINKAADAGYKIIVVLTGTIETLRKQTQKRIDEGFVGFDSDTSIQKGQKCVGVGLDPLSKKGLKAASFTSRSSDFDTRTANALGLSMAMLTAPVIIVAKKNVKVLERITEWLQQNNNMTNGKIDHPLLVIDDEADNASINTRSDEDDNPTRTNACIRSLLFLFSKYTYVGYTATPFANVFINPDGYKPELGPDLFPSDFIFSLTPNESYIGGKDIFLEDAKYRKALIANDDCDEVLPASHKKGHDFKKLPSTLKDALILFAITNVIRDLRDDESAHRAMLVNISRFISMHDVIRDQVNAYFDKILSSFFALGKTSEDDAITKKAEELYNREYASTQNGTLWYEVKSKIYDSNKDVMILSINSDNDMLNYAEYSSCGARAIFIGGLSLSRGLTLEGLCISYFFRYSKTYDVLFQMGRWFGYRPHYDDLFRIFMPNELIGWYATITESMEQLRIDLVKMQKAGKKPKDFGIRVMNDSTKLKITSANKMKSAETDYDTVIGFGEIFGTPDIYADPESSKKNCDITMGLLAKDVQNNGLKIETDPVSGNKCIKGISIETILGIVDRTNFSPANDTYDKEAMLDFLNRYRDQYFSEWDVAFPEGRKDINENILHIDVLDVDIHLTKKNFDTYYNYLRMQGAREQLHNPIDTTSCLDSVETKKKIEDEYAQLCEEIHPSSGKGSKKRMASAKHYLTVKERRPLLLIYCIELSDKDPNESKEKAIARFKEANVFPFGIAIAIPKYTDEISKTTAYKINLVEQRKRREKENYINDYDSDEEA